MEVRPVDTADYIEYGWVCPKCGGVYSPTQMFCLKCSNLIYTTTTNAATPAGEAGDHTIVTDGRGGWYYMNDAVVSNLAAQKG